MEFAYAMRPLFSRAVAEHEALMTEAGALEYLRKTGWAKIYRSEKTFAEIGARAATWPTNSAFRIAPWTLAGCSSSSPR